MNILFKIEDFLFELFPKVKASGNNLSVLKDELESFYSFGPYKPEVKITDGLVEITIDIPGVASQKADFDKAIRFCEVKRFNEAKGVLTKLIKQNPTVSEYHRVLGQVFSEQGDQEEAINSLIDALAEIQIDEFVFKIERGVKSKVSFNKGNGDVIDLFHDFSYDTALNKNVRSFTVSQRPDIVLRITKNDLKENYALTYLYDAKYRLASDEKEGWPDLPPEDAINQMHRYRDAIYYVNRDKMKPEKEVIGAYILFPGSGELDSIKNTDYFKSIATVNIGAFPLRPNDFKNRALLEEHLQMILGIDTESVLNDVSPQKENTYESPNPYVLIGFVPTENHMLCFENSVSPFYFSGVKKPSKFGFSNLKYFAPYIKKRGVKDYYEIIDYQIMERNKIFKISHPLYKDDTDERLVIRFGKKYQVDKGKYLKISDGSIGQIPYKYTNLKNIRTPINNKIEVLKVSQ